MTVKVHFEDQKRIILSDVQFQVCYKAKVIKQFDKFICKHYAGYKGHCVVVLCDCNAQTSRIHGQARNRIATF